MLKALGITFLVVGVILGAILAAPFIGIIGGGLLIFWAIHYELTNSDDQDDNQS